MGEKFKSKHPKLAEFIENKAPNILNAVGGVLPDKGALGILKNIITSSPDISSEDKLVLKVLMELLRRDYVNRNVVNKNIEIIKTKKFIFPICKN